MKRKQFGVVGLGRFGSAPTLTELGHDVVGVDADESRVQQLARRHPACPADRRDGREGTASGRYSGRFVGRRLKQLELRPKLGLTLIAIKRRSADTGAIATNVAPTADEIIRSGDVLALLGSNERLGRLDQLLAR